MLSTGLLFAPALSVWISLVIPTVEAAQAPEFESDRQFAEHYGWIYNDMAGGMQKAQREGRPLMVVIRCPP